MTEAGTPPTWQRTATLRFERIAGLGGSDITADEAVASLERLGFAVQSRDATRVTVAVPSWRNDIAAKVALEQAETLDPGVAAKAAEGCAEIEPECDLIEEVLRLRGLDAVPPVSLPRASPVPLATLTPKQVRTELARRTLAAQGLAECVTFSFMAQSEAALFGDSPEALRLTNPIAADLDQLRPTPIATLALAAQRNAARGYPDVALFEIGPEFAIDAAENQRWIAAGLRAGATPRNWLAPSRPVDAMDAKADLWAVHVGDRRAARRADADPGRARLLSPRPLRHRAAGTEDRAGQLWRTAPARARGARSRRPCRGVPARPGRRRRAEAPAQGRAGPAAIPADPPRLRLPGG